MTAVYLLSVLMGLKYTRLRQVPTNEISKKFNEISLVSWIVIKEDKHTRAHGCTYSVTTILDLFYKIRNVN
jgi:hypothetical protein